MPPMQRPSVKRRSGRACASFRSRPNSSRRTVWCSEPVISWCVSAPLLEYGYVFPKGITHVEALVALVEDLQSSLPDSVRIILKLLVDTFTALEAQIAVLDAEINQRSKSDPTARRLMTIPGVGPITSTAIAGASGRGVSGRARFRGLARTDTAAA